MGLTMMVVGVHRSWYAPECYTRCQERSIPQRTNHMAPTWRRICCLLHGLFHLRKATRLFNDLSAEASSESLKAISELCERLMSQGLEERGDQGAKWS